MFTQRQEIRDWLDSMKITRYVIHNDLTVDVEGNVNLSSKHLVELPVQFGVIHGAFVLSDNALITLKGCPHTINGNFWCNTNKLKNLQFGPQTVTGSYNCGYNQIDTLEYLASTINEGLDCSNNQLSTLKGLEKFDKMYNLFINNNKLTSLEYSPNEIEYAFHFENNQVKNFEHLPSKMESLNCSHNPISSIEGIHCKLGIFRFTHTNISLEDVVEMNFLKQAKIIFTPSDVKLNASFTLDDNEDEACLTLDEVQKIQLKNRLDRDLAQNEQSSEEMEVKASPKFKI